MILLKYLIKSLAAHNNISMNCMGVSHFAENNFNKYTVSEHDKSTFNHDYIIKNFYAVK